ncbi:outer membrane transport energization protein TonB [Azospirillum brasilense]|uniref:Outer membrane transport energization protein TonB n=1 Tax=Azospirillum brasilense TaxID=192 RepID=A0A560AHD3_AZOBR|nr:energy transducer TonB [Azospirillum brasilense]TWA59775.1 outer membrane transport energization protein TonB [Azospirillum brasilense]
MRAIRLHGCPPPAPRPLGALALSGTLHAGVLAVLLSAAGAAPGTVTEETGAVSLNDAITPVIEVMLVASEADSGPPPAAAAEPESEPEITPEIEPQRDPAPEPEPEPTPEPVPPVVEPTPEPAPEPPPPPPPKPLPKPAPKPPVKAAPKPQAAPTATPSPTPSAETGTGRNAAAAVEPVSASRGAVVDYGAQVWAWIGRHKPEKVVGGGQATVTLTLGPAGEVLDAAILTSSGDAALDRAALAAVRKASPFPTPPPGLTAADRVFSVPFLFRPR